MREERYRQNFANLLRKRVGGYVFHPQDFFGNRNQQPDLMHYPGLPAFIELKRWNRKKKDWRIDYVKRQPREALQLLFYERKVSEGFRVFYVVYRIDKVHRGDVPDWIYFLNQAKYLSLEEFLQEIRR